MAEREKNVHQKSWWSLGSDFSIIAHDFQMGLNGTNVYQLYAVTDDKKQSSINLSEGGLLSIYNDESIEIVAGKKGAEGGVDIMITSRSGDITITADKNGQIRIRGSSIVIDADGDLDMNVGKDLNMKIGGGLGIKANVANLEAQTGNMLPEGTSFAERCFAESHVGSSAVRGFKITDLFT